MQEIAERGSVVWTAWPRGHTANARASPFTRPTWCNLHTQVLAKKSLREFSKRPIVKELSQEASCLRFGRLPDKRKPSALLGKCCDAACACRSAPTRGFTPPHISQSICPYAAADVKLAPSPLITASKCSLPSAKEGTFPAPPPLTLPRDGQLFLYLIDNKYLIEHGRLWEDGSATALNLPVGLGVRTLRVLTSRRTGCSSPAIWLIALPIGLH